MKRVIAACIDRILEFDSLEEMNGYIDSLSRKGKKFQVANREAVGDGKVRIWISEQYNNSTMIGEVKNVRR